MELEDFLQKMGERIKKLRKIRGLTQENFDEGEFAIPVRTLQEIEAARSNATIASLFKIANKLNVKIKEIVDI